MRDLEEVMIKSLDERRRLNRKHLNDKFAEEKVNNAKLIRDEAKTLCGKYVDYYGCHCGYLLGATCGSDDYYWLYITSDFKICFSSCVGNPNELEEIPSVEYNALDYVIKNDPQSIIDKVKERFERCDDVMLTPLYINGKEYTLEV